VGAICLMGLGEATSVGWFRWVDFAKLKSLGYICIFHSELCF
jgi:hypothetical protein